MTRPGATPRMWRPSNPPSGLEVLAAGITNDPPARAERGYQVQVSRAEEEAIIDMRGGELRPAEIDAGLRGYAAPPRRPTARADPE
ncbi:hypothetical protein ACQP1G_37785 [Nocardia sp. CA-107356]|uniref:hypothetical protein n=1 Tax=Nocardia sp. CA-107356 TaxID=3239972 RepID=UPI003D933A7A